MDEERFVMISRTEDEFRICDRVNDNNLMNMDEILDCLNEQQATITKLKEAIKIAYEEKPFPQIEDIQAKFKELKDEWNI